MDMDGVIIPDFVHIISRFLVDRIHDFVDFPEEAILNYYRTVTGFHPAPALDLLVNGLGLDDHLETIRKELGSLTEWKGVKATLEDHFGSLLLSGKENGFPIYIFSYAGPLRRQLVVDAGFPESQFIAPGKSSKGSEQTYTELSRIIREKEGENVDLFYIDDSPMALRAASASGFTTTWYDNGMLLEYQVAPFEPYINKKVKSLKELDLFLRTGK